MNRRAEEWLAKEDTKKEREEGGNGGRGRGERRERKTGGIRKKRHFFGEIGEESVRFDYLLLYLILFFRITLRFLLIFRIVF